MKLLQSFTDSTVNDLIPNFLPLLAATWLLAARKSHGERCHDKMSEALICRPTPLMYVINSELLLPLTPLPQR